MIKIHHLGIDFGSSKTSVVGYSETEDRFVLFYDQKAPSTQAFQTSTAVKMNGEHVVEYAFFRRAEDIVWSETGSRPTTDGVWKSVETLKESLVETNATLDTREQITRECVKQFFYEIFNALTDAVYEDYIIELVGKFGLLLLRECKLLEPCGVIGGRQLYTLVK
jgi:hypothetical protein